jgi:hypothetical protein
MTETMISIPDSLYNGVQALVAKGICRLTSLWRWLWGRSCRR